MILLSETLHRARVAHQCDGCNGTIGVGDLYYRQANKDGGDLYTWRAHGLCREITSELAIVEDGVMWFEQSDVRDEIERILRGLCCCDRHDAARLAFGLRAIEQGVRR